jgi:hypothetical protein
MGLHNCQAAGQFPYTRFGYPASGVVFVLSIAQIVESQCSIHLAYWNEEFSCTAPGLVTFQFHSCSFLSHLVFEHPSLASPLSQPDLS